MLGKFKSQFFLIFSSFFILIFLLQIFFLEKLEIKEKDYKNEILNFVSELEILSNNKKIENSIEFIKFFKSEKNISGLYFYFNSSQNVNITIFNFFDFPLNITIFGLETKTIQLNSYVVKSEIFNYSTFFYIKFLNYEFQADCLNCGYLFFIYTKGKDIISNFIKLI